MLWYAMICYDMMWYTLYILYTISYRSWMCWFISNQPALGHQARLLAPGDCWRQQLQRGVSLHPQRGGWWLKTVMSGGWLRNLQFGMVESPRKSWDFQHLSTGAFATIHSMIVWGFLKVRGTQKSGLMMENPSANGWFRGTPILGNLHVLGNSGTG